MELCGKVLYAGALMSRVGGNKNQGIGVTRSELAAMLPDTGVSTLALVLGVPPSGRAAAG